MTTEAGAPPFSHAVTDLKQWVYCPRILYYHHCLPKVRPVTYKMEAGIEAGREEVRREARRSLQRYGLDVDGATREFNVAVSSERLGLRGEVDMVITLAGGEVIPVDYKLADRAGPHFKLQLAAYAALLEEARGGEVRRGFLYYLPLQRAEAVAVDARLRRSLASTLEHMRAALEHEQMPAPTPHLRKCLACEFRRFCNDVL
jgi:CRISPR-associated exonuclease Cas4